MNQTLVRGIEGMPLPGEKPQLGTVVRFDAVKGFGFIQADDPDTNFGGDVFVLKKFCPVDPVTKLRVPLQEGERVEFTLAYGKTGNMATRVKRVESEKR